MASVQWYIVIWWSLILGCLHWSLICYYVYIQLFMQASYLMWWHIDINMSTWWMSLYYDYNQICLVSWFFSLTLWSYCFCILSLLLYFHWSLVQFPLYLIISVFLHMHVCWGVLYVTDFWHCLCLHCFSFFHYCFIVLITFMDLHELIN